MKIRVSTYCEKRGVSGIYMVPIEKHTNMATNTNNSETRCVDLTPTWVGVLPLLLAAAGNGSRTALQELQRMARQADLLKLYLEDEKSGAELAKTGEASR